MYVQSNKICGLNRLIQHIQEGDCIAVGGGLSWREPMAALREIIRQETGKLHLVGSAHGIDVDLLCGAGSVAICEESYVGFEQDFGMAPNYRRACESGSVTVRDSCCYTLVQQLRAAISGLPFMPVRSIQGTGFMSLHHEYHEMVCPFSGEKLVLLPALKPDVAILHVQYADKQGNLHIEGPPVADILFAKASKTVLATVEKLISTEQMIEKGVTIPYFYVTAITEVNYGAHPTSCYPFYAYDRAHTAHYYHYAGKGTTAFDDNYLHPFVFDCPSQESYLQAIGGEKVLKHLSDWNKDTDLWKALYA